jgi:predicted alpha/beta-hydrolase family hydrolase
MTGAEPGKPGKRRRDALDGVGSPRLVLVREPDQLGVERAHPQLAFGVRLVELAEPDPHVAADDDRMPASLDDDHLPTITNYCCRISEPVLPRTVSARWRDFPVGMTARSA